MASVTIVGPGRMGLALGTALHRTGTLDRVVFYGRQPEPPWHPLLASGEALYVYGMEPPRPDTRAVFLAVPEAAVPEISEHLAAQGPAPEGAAAFHLSRTLPTDVLGPLHAAGWAVGAFRPLVLAGRSPASADRIPGAAVALTAGPEASRVARELAGALGCTVLPVPAQGRPLVDAVYALAASHLPILLHAATDLLARVGLGEEEATAAVAPLVRSVLAEVEASGVAVALAEGGLRGGAERAALHLRALDADDRRLYATVTRRASALAGHTAESGTLEELLERFEHEIG